MSDETHDQNQGLETPDTAPSRGRVIGLAIIMYALVACLGYVFIVQMGSAVNLDGIGDTAGDDEIANASPYPRAVYLAPQTGRLLIDEQIAYANLEVVTDTVSLATTLGNYPEIQVVFVDPRAISPEGLPWLQQPYQTGKTLVAFNTSHSAFSQAVGLPAEFPDLPADEVDRRLLAISLHRLDPDTAGPIELAATYDQFDQLLTIVHNIASGR